MPGDIKSTSREQLFAPLTLFADVEWQQLDMRMDPTVGPAIVAFETK